ncbi:MAG: GNAT family N-acetyltransferase [Methanomicrobium sp.]|nr:GNAT family N-acetyltransferase [Methanomicrobium sp.]
MAENEISFESDDSLKTGLSESKGIIPDVRELKSSEFLKANAIWVDYHNTTGDPKTDRLFGVFLGNKLVSVARFKKHPDSYEVDGVFTPEEFRKKGYSHLAVSALVEACHNDDLYMYAVSELKDFYSRYGFEEILEKELPEGVGRRYAWAVGNMEGVGVVPMKRISTNYIE